MSVRETNEMILKFATVLAGTLPELVWCERVMVENGSPIEFRRDRDKHSEKWGAGIWRKRFQERYAENKLMSFDCENHETASKITNQTIHRAHMSLLPSSLFFNLSKIASLLWIQSIQEGTQSVFALGLWTQTISKVKGFTREDFRKNFAQNLERIDPIASNNTWENRLSILRTNTKKWDIQQCNIWWFQQLSKNSLNIPRSRKPIQKKHQKINRLVGKRWKWGRLRKSNYNSNNSNNCTDIMIQNWKIQKKKFWKKNAISEVIY